MRRLESVHSAHRVGVVVSCKPFLNQSAVVLIVSTTEATLRREPSCGIEGENMKRTDECIDEQGKLMS